ncbi:neural cell adhesion molecule 1-B-like [Chironomus tepperi]|uniref:neural cell adhesion molecule 1-B-like n=1 Tax=Chironomus tepperi TaxID=113505 RepID=UPI00391F4F62
MHSKKHIINIIVIFICAIIGLSNAEEGDEESEELQRKVEELSIIPDEKVFIHSVNDSRMITCIGNDIKWRSANGTYVDTYDQKERIHVEDFSSPLSDNQQLRLIFKEIYEMDHGDWTCVGLYEEKSFTLFVYVPVEFVPVPESITVNELQDVKISCEAIGRPAPEISWMFNGKLITDTINTTKESRHIQLADGLYIKNVTRKDAGDYTCKAFQLSSKLSYFNDQIIQLDVHFKPEMLRPTANITKIYTILNAFIELTCEIIGNPYPRIIWFHEGKKVSHHNIVNENNLSTLKIHLHNNKSFGDYKCVAKNDIGEARSFFSVLPGLRPEPPAKLKLIGTGDQVLDIDIGATQPNLTADIFAITQYRFEVMSKDDYDVQGDWKNYNITDVEAQSNVSYLITQLSPNTTYVVRVASINNVGLSERTEMYEFTTLANAPKKQKNEPDSAVKHFSGLSLVVLGILLNLMH